MKPSSETTKNSPNSCTLVVMAKAPRPGMDKTRLAQSLPVEAVTELYCCLLDDTIALARSLGTAEVVIMCPASDVEELNRLALGAMAVVAQKGEGLAAGLTSVFAHLASSSGQRVIAFNAHLKRLPITMWLWDRQMMAAIIW
jgi:glycosyltransferase A (GT-A) superfamily protein (DUF2064 family)